jgi:hypothetical protein
MFVVSAFVHQLLPWPRIGTAFAVFLAFAGLTARTHAAEGAERAERPTLIIAVGAPGEDEFGTGFSQWATQLEQYAEPGKVNTVVIGLKGSEAVPGREKLQLALANEPKEGSAELWLVLIGHGTFDGKEAKFNLRGVDISATELQGWLQPFQRPVAVINTTAASSPFLNKLSATNRVLITATRSGGEINFTRFGKFFCQSVGSLEADLDKDGQTSLLEAFLMAARQAKEWYDSEGRLLTEHPLLDDNGDGMGTPPDWFRGIRATKTARGGAALDGLRAHQFHLIRSEFEAKLSPEVRARRDQIELNIARLRDQKSTLKEDEYYQQLETLLLEIARLYEQTK